MPVGTHTALLITIAVLFTHSAHYYYRLASIVTTTTDVNESWS
jgi:hypothetical protein